MTYKAHYTFEGNSKGMPYLSPGDKLELTNGKAIRIKWVRIHEGETVYDTDGLGIVYSRELERI